MYSCICGFLFVFVSNLMVVVLGNIFGLDVCGCFGC